MDTIGLSTESQNSNLMVHLYFSKKYNFVIELSNEASFATADVFKLGSNKGTDMGSLVIENEDELLI